MNKTVKTLAMAGMVALSLTSCKQLYYQVYDVQPVSAAERDNRMVFENADLSVSYDLWSEGGQLDFMVENKTDKTIFIDMGQSFFVRNGNAYDYFLDREFSKSSSINKKSSASASYGFLASFVSGVTGLNTTYPASVSNTESISAGSVSGVVTHEKRIMAIPPHTYKMVNEYMVNPRLLIVCDKKADYPSHSVIVEQYTEDNSPYVFGNYFTYAYTEDMSECKTFRNDFYVSAITNYAQKDIVKSESVKNCDIPMDSKVTVFKVHSPRRMYKVYIRKM